MVSSRWQPFKGVEKPMTDDQLLPSCRLSFLQICLYRFDNKSKTLRHGVLSLLESANLHNDATRERDAI